MDLNSIAQLEKAGRRGRSDSFRLGVGLVFVVGIMLWTGLTQGATGQNALMMIAAAMIGGYMAMNIGANDVANNVGPAVGSRALTLGSALVIAAIFEAAGAIIAGGEVVGTIRSGIINPALIPDTDTFVWIMMAALMAGALWLNIATATGAPPRQRPTTSVGCQPLACTARASRSESSRSSSAAIQRFGAVLLTARRRRRRSA